MSFNKNPLCYELDAVENEALLKREGQLQAAETVLADLKRQTSPLPHEVCVSITVPEEQWLKRVETGIEKINRVVEPAGIIDRIKQKAIRQAVGLQGELHPVRHERDQNSPQYKMHVFLNLSGISRDDLERVSKFLDTHARRIKKESRPV
jgi:hypothetical protein